MHCLRQVPWIEHFLKLILGFTVNLVCLWRTISWIWHVYVASVLSIRDTVDSNEPVLLLIKAAGRSHLALRPQLNVPFANVEGDSRLGSWVSFPSSAVNVLRIIRLHRSPPHGPTVDTPVAQARPESSPPRVTEVASVGVLGYC